MWGDDPLGNTADEFPDDPTEWKDTDGDGLGITQMHSHSTLLKPQIETVTVTVTTHWEQAQMSSLTIRLNGKTMTKMDLGDNQLGTESDPFLSDFDNDGYNDSIDVLPKLYSPGDLDNDGYLDDVDWAPSDPREWSDFDGDGKGDNEDPDDDNDGYADTDELRQKTDPFDASSVPMKVLKS